MIDTSGSIKSSDPGNFDLVLDFVKQTTKRFNVGKDLTHVGVVQFSSRADVEFHLDEFYTQQELYDAIDKTTYQGKGTNLAEGMELARTELFQASPYGTMEIAGDRPDVPNLAIVISDGKPNRDTKDTVPEANMLKEIATVIQVGVTDGVDEMLLKDIASDGRTLLVEDFDTLDKELDSLLNITCPEETSEDPGMKVNHINLLR